MLFDPSNLPVISPFEFNSWTGLYVLGLGGKRGEQQLSSTKYELDEIFRDRFSGTRGIYAHRLYKGHPDLRLKRYDIGLSGNRACNNWAVRRTRWDISRDMWSVMRRICYLISLQNSLEVTQIDMHLIKAGKENGRNSIKEEDEVSSSHVNNVNKLIKELTKSFPLLTSNYI